MWSPSRQNTTSDVMTCRTSVVRGSKPVAVAR
jgi:hypothetical protein